MTISSDNEIWVLVANVQALFGFNPASASWDRIIRVPLNPGSGLLAAGPGRLVMSGAVNVRGKGTSYLAVIDTASGRSSVMPPQADSFGLIDDNTAVYAQPTSTLGEFNIGKLNLSDGSTTTLAAKPPLNSLALVTDASGRVWFSMSGYWTIGIARLDPSTGAIKEFPFAYVKHPGTPEPVVSSCPSPARFMDRCYPQYAYPSACCGNPEVQQLVIDKKGNVWVITAQPGTPLPGQEITEGAAMTPVVELVAGS
jgi:hypothetical protein